MAPTQALPQQLDVRLPACVRRKNLSLRQKGRFGSKTSKKDRIISIQALAADPPRSSKGEKNTRI